MRSMTRAGATLLLLGLMCGAFSADWPQYMGPTANGIAPDTGINKDWNAKPPKVEWKVALGDRGFAGPCVADGKVFIIDHAGDKDIVRALKLDTGQEVWRFPYPDTARENYGFARSTPCYSNGRLYTLSRLGLVNCLDATDGTPYWSVNIRQDFGGQAPEWDYSASPIVDEGKVILCPGGQTGIVALDARSGDTVWTGGKPGVPGYASPVVANIQGVKQYVIFAGKHIYGAAAADGKVLWSVPWETSYDVNAAQPIVAGNFVFFSSNYGKGCSLIEITPDGVTTHWTNKNLQAHFNSPVFTNNCFFGIGDRYGLVCINPRDGEILWNNREMGQKGGVVAVDGVLIGINSDSGAVVMFSNSFESYQELGRFTPLGGQSWTMPVIADGKLIIRNKEAICCVDIM
ncbi:MAG: PQQ-like beta-propeller repeat protein [Armatimonadetes bacterium]|nr:PQQ-like beta-propeller repeat protein [Armatimonadota bacterium]